MDGYEEVPYPEGMPAPAWAASITGACSLRYRLGKHALAADVDEEESLASVPGDRGRETSPPSLRR